MSNPTNVIKGQSVKKLINEFLRCIFSEGKFKESCRQMGKRKQLMLLRKEVHVVYGTKESVGAQGGKCV